MATKQDIDRAIKGSRERITKLRKRGKANDKIIARFNKSKNGKATAADRQSGPSSVRTAIDDNNIVLRDIAGNERELKASIARRKKAPSSFKELPTGGGNTTDASELKIFIDNDSKAQRNIRLAIHPNLDKKAKKGIFDAVASQKVWRFEVDRGDKEYQEKELGKGKNPSGFFFSVPTRNIVAKKLAAEYVDDNRHHIAKGRKNLLNA